MWRVASSMTMGGLMRRMWPAGIHARIELNRQPIPNFSTFQRLAEPLRSTDLALLLINRQGSLLYIPIQSE